jgi:hypothetical protein
MRPLGTQTKEEILKVGLLLCRYTLAEQARYKQENLVYEFKIFFRSFPKVLVAIWQDLVTSMDPAIRLEDKQQTIACLQAFLRAFFFLRHYPTIEVMARFFAIGKTACKGKAIWDWIDRVHLLREKKIVWKERWYDPDSERFNITVDGVHCRIQEPMHETWSKNPKYYSHKNNTSGFNYEIAISVVEGHCCWINGPFPAGRNDMSIYNEPEGLKEKNEDVPGQAGDRRFGIPRRRGRSHTFYTEFP